MDFSQLFIFGGILTYVGIVIYLANHIDLDRSGVYAASRSDQENGWLDTRMMETWLRWLHYGLVGMMFMLGFVALQAAFLEGVSSQLPNDVQAQIPQVSLGWAVVLFVLAAATSVLSLQLIARPELRLRIQAWLNRLGGAYDPESRVHNSAVLLVLAASVYFVASFVLEGGVSGIAQSIQQQGLDAGDVVFQAVIQVVITLLGVGFAIRRDVAQTLDRLGLRPPTTQDVLWGIGGGLGFWLVSLVVELVWSLLTSPELLQEQTAAANQLNLAFATLPLAFILSASSAIGEEIWIRGGLQPVFGMVVTSAFFTILHTQVAFTPAMLVIFGLSLGLGWLRKRQSTVASIIAHFCFNFIQLALLSVAVQAI